MGDIDLIIGWQEYETTFMENKVSMKIRPLKRWAWYMLAPVLERGTPRKPKESAKEYLARLSPDEKRELTNVSDKMHEMAAKIFPEHVKDFEGITVNGKPVTFEIMSEEVVFGNLCVEICGKLAEISAPSKADEKNSDGLSRSQTSDKSDPSK